MSIITLTPTAPVSPADLIWEEPPAPKNASTGAYAGVAAALKARPGEWAVLRTFGSTTSEKKRAWGAASRFQSKPPIDMRPTSEGRFEATSRSCDDGRVRVYVRYLPTADVAQLPTPRVVA